MVYLAELLVVMTDWLKMSEFKVSVSLIRQAHFKREKL